MGTLWIDDSRARLSRAAGLTALAIHFFLPPTGQAQPGDELPPDLTRLSLQELMNINVTSVSGRPEPWFTAPSAIHVITQEDLRESGVTSFAEALRLAPGMDVARVDNHTWAVSARGFNSMFSDKLLVLMDGRAVYTPLFGGVFWDDQDTLLEDVDRIEVIRGPGATLWGANAVNGVVNLVTRSAADTPGLLVLGGGGFNEQAFGAARFGGQFGEDAYYRVYGKYFKRDDAPFSDGTDANDQWQVGRFGFRTDWTPGVGNQLTFQGDAYLGVEGQTFQFSSSDPFVHDDLHTHGGNLLGRWTHEFTDSSDVQLQAYYDHLSRNVLPFSFRQDTFDIQLQHRRRWGDRQTLLVGAGYRLVNDHVENRPIVSFDPNDKVSQLASAFVQDEIAVLPDYLTLTLGSKLEHNDSSGWEVEPSARLAWTPTARQTVWAAVSRAVRTPARSDEAMRFQVDTVPLPMFFLGNAAFEPEHLLAYELGYRARPTEQLSFDVTAFCNVYDDLRSIEQSVVAGPPPYVSIQVANKLRAETYGAELTARWKPLTWWRLEATYSWLDMEVHHDATSTDTDREEGDSPQHQASLRSVLNLPYHVDFSCWLRFVDRLPEQDIPSYLTVDARLSWRPTPDWELAIVGQNLLDTAHPEFTSLFTIQRTEVERSVYGKVTWRF
jgi:iron complex outermembrane receptor protein